jgi:predicted Zn-dependent protease
MQQFTLRVAHTLKPITPKKADPFIDDCGVKGPRSRYDNEPIPENPDIRRFVWEYAQNLDDFLGTLIMAGITASGMKTVLAAFDLHIVGSVVSYEGWKVSPSLVQRILDWPVPTSVSEVRSFLGLAGGACKWILRFTMIAKLLTVLLRIVTVEFRITDEAIEAQESLKRKISSAPVLVRLDYDAAKLISHLPRVSDEGLMIVGIDSSWMGSGWVIYQITNGSKSPALYGSCTFNATEQNYGQPKTEVYGVFRAFKELHHRIWGVHFRLDHDAKSLAKIL